MDLDELIDARQREVSGITELEWRRHRRWRRIASTWSLICRETPTGMMILMGVSLLLASMIPS
ncbi:hypothetical protein [Bosea sp. NPDC055594]